MFWLQLKALVKHLVLPPAGPLLFALIGVTLINRRQVLARTFLIAGIGSLWLMSTPFISNAIAGLAQHYPPVDLRSAADAQAIVILGGGGQRAFAPEYGGPSADALLLERLTYGAFLAHRTGLPILVTGFFIEAQAMHDTLQRNFGIDARWVDNRAYDTYENARNAAQLLKADGVHRIIFVTHASQMWRAVHEFTDAGIESIPAPLGMRVDPRARRSAIFAECQRAGTILLGGQRIVGRAGPRVALRHASASGVVASHRLCPVSSLPGRATFRGSRMQLVDELRRSTCLSSSTAACANPATRRWFSALQEIVEDTPDRPNGAARVTAGVRRRLNVRE